MSLYQVTPGGVWYYYLVRDGRRLRRSTGTRDRQEAQRIHDVAAIAAWSRRRHGAGLSDALALWFQAAQRGRNDANAVRHFLTLYPDRPLADVTGLGIAQALADKGPATANRSIAILQSALNHAHRAGLCDPIHIPRRKVPRGRLRWLDDDEWGALHAELPDHLKPAALFALETGLRQANVLGLTWAQVDLRRRVCWIDAADAKSRAGIGIPLSDGAIAALRAVIGQHKTWCFTWRGRPIGSPKTAFNKAMARAGIEGATWHTLRHTFASRKVAAGCPLKVLMELGGWKDVQSVMIYAHLAPEHLAQWANVGSVHATVHATPKARKPRKPLQAPVAQWIEQPPPNELAA